MNTTIFRINIQSAKSCMTSDVMQQMMIDLIFFPYALQAMQACIVKYNTHNSAQFVVKFKGVHVICTLPPGKITVARTTVKNKSIKISSCVPNNYISIFTQLLNLTHHVN